MPIARGMNKVVLFSHIPKCGGASVEAYLQEQGLTLAFIDNNFRADSSKKWCRTSPQHVDGATLCQLFPSDFFDHFFTVVRHPITRFKSAFMFQKYREKTIGPNVNINDFAQLLHTPHISLDDKFDKHFLPQHMFLYPDVPYNFFHIEGGMDAVKEYIDALFFDNSLYNSIPHLNKGNSIKNIEEDVLTSLAIEMVECYYKKDFEIFGYIRKNNW